MGYEVYITRADYSWDALETPISEDEWISVAIESNEIMISKNDYYSCAASGKIYPWVITSLPNKPFLWFMDGAIHSVHPDKETIIKMVSLAKTLDAKVIGEEGEVYDDYGACSPN